MRYLTYIPPWYQALRKDLVWRVKPKSEAKAIYLTFDDGPIPDITPWVLQQLSSYQAKATFFCIGDNVKKHPDILAQVSAAKHAIGNHTYNHLNGRKTSTEVYLTNFRACADLVPSALFRPPYGRITQKQARAITRAGSKIIMWDCLAADWDPRVSPEKSFRLLRKHIKPGSIVVFHDSLKAWPRLKEVLPRVLDYYSNQGYVFKALSPEIL